MEEEFEKEEEQEILEEKNNDRGNGVFISVIIICTIVAIILIVLIVSMILGGNKKEKSNNNHSDDKKPNTQSEVTNVVDPELEEDTRVRIPRLSSIIFLYRKDGELIEDSYCDELCKGSSNGYMRIEVEDINAKVLDYSPKMEYKNTFPNFVLFKDGEKIKYFKTSVFTSYNSGMKSSYIKYKIIESNGEIEAIYFKDKKEKGIFNVKTKKYMYVNQFDKFESIGPGIIVGIKDDKKSVLLLSEEKKLENIDLDKLEKLTKLGNFNVDIEYSKDGKLYTIYDNKYNILINNIDSNLTFIDNDTLYYTDGKKVFGYTSNGNKIYESKASNEKVLLILKDYYVGFNNNKFELRLLKDESIVLSDYIYDYNLDYYHSGYKDKSEMTSMIGTGIYLTFIKEKNGTINILEEYYDIKTGTSDKKENTR